MNVTIDRIFNEQKGILAADESINTMNKRLESVGLPATKEYRDKWREIIVSTEGLEKHISGIILSTETFEQKDDEGVELIKKIQKKKILLGVKLDEGLEDLDNGEQITKGLYNLKEKADIYKGLGASFAKWRCVYKVEDSL